VGHAASPHGPGGGPANSRRTVQATGRHRSTLKHSKTDRKAKYRLTAQISVRFRCIGNIGREWAAFDRESAEDSTHAARRLARPAMRFREPPAPVIQDSVSCRKPSQQGHSASRSKPKARAGVDPRAHRRGKAPVPSDLVIRSPSISVPRAEPMDKLHLSRLPDAMEGWCSRCGRFTVD